MFWLKYGKDRLFLQFVFSIGRKLVDVKSSGALNLNQFCMAMLLIQKRLAGMVSLPSSLPAHITQSFFPSDPSFSLTPSSLSTLGTATDSLRKSDLFPGSPSFSASTAGGMDEWSISFADRSKFESYFSNLDTRKVGFLTGILSTCFVAVIFVRCGRWAFLQEIVFA
jgi:hypothetical protein